MIAAHRKRGICNQLLAVMARDLTDMRARMQIQGASATEQFPFWHGGRQGGVETPDEFNVYLEVALEQFVLTWRTRGWGFSLDGVVVSHVLWCDNIFVLASSACQLEVMVEELTDAVYQSKLTWKLSSLEFMVCGKSPPPQSNLEIVVPNAVHTYNGSSRRSAGSSRI